MVTMTTTTATLFNGNSNKTATASLFNNNSNITKVTATLFNGNSDKTATAALFNGNSDSNNDQLNNINEGLTTLNNQLTSS